MWHMPPALLWDSPPSPPFALGPPAPGSDSSPPRGLCPPSPAAGGGRLPLRTAGSACSGLTGPRGPPRCEVTSPRPAAGAASPTRDLLPVCPSCTLRAPGPVRVTAVSLPLLPVLRLLHQPGRISSILCPSASATGAHILPPLLSDTHLLWAPPRHVLPPPHQPSCATARRCWAHSAPGPPPFHGPRRQPRVVSPVS